MSDIVVVASGSAATQSVPEGLDPIGHVIAADGGADLAMELGLVPTVVVGDMDSISEKTEELLRSRHTLLVQHSSDKDQTDLDIAMHRALEANVQRIVVLGGHGGRVDHLMGNLALLDATAEHPSRVEAWLGPDLVVPLTGSVEFRPLHPTTVSLVPRPTAVLTTSGLRWGLDRETLGPEPTRGISNESTGGTVGVTVHSGTCFVVVPNAIDPLPRGILT